MDEGKILLANLSQGRLGEDNAQLLGAMLITKFQVTSMRRVDIPKELADDIIHAYHKLSGPTDSRISTISFE